MSGQAQLPHSKVAASAYLSHCGQYRYTLHRAWNLGVFGIGPVCLFVMLNPSTADANTDDPTIRRCIGFAKRFGCGELQVVNLFAMRATNPAELKTRVHVVGLENNPVILAAAGRAFVTVVAWGNHGSFLRRDRVVCKLLSSHLTKDDPVFCFGVTKAGQPRHPLYIKADAPLIPFDLSKHARGEPQ